MVKYMFLGEYNPNLTDGSRIALPKKLRSALGGKKVVISKGFDKCLFIYRASDWEEKVQKQVLELTQMQHLKRSDLERYLYTSATEVSVDSQGRIVIPSDLLNYAGLKKQTAVIGVGDHIEVWDQSTWKARIDKISAQLSL